MRFALLGSGSRGNAALICAGRTQLLLDCGLGLAEALRRLSRLGVEAAELSGILVTHEHGDHLGGVGALARRFGLPVWMTPGTCSVWRNPVPSQLRMITPHEAFVIDDLQVQPYPVPHDAREPCQFVFSDGRLRLGVLSDAGSVTVHMRSTLDVCDGLLLEFNHDPDLLAAGPYPESLKRRVGGAYGHLSNTQAASLLQSVDCSRLQHLVLTHLSETNNTPKRALDAARSTQCCDPNLIVCADQSVGLDWRQLA